ncbi:MAG: glycosyltransferase family 2 protein [Chitinophagales bacterium]|nr:glycosyltransferase family 2 protein [Chitinophagales bacterium]
MHKFLIDVLIPAYNEELSIAKVIGDINKQLVREIVVIDNNSRDLTSINATNAGATVIQEKRQGYGAACLKGITFLQGKKLPPDIVVFMDADYSDRADEMEQLISPIINGDAQLVIGSRALGIVENKAMTIPQIFGNWLATRMLQLFYGVRFTDLGPFRAIRWESLLSLKMEDTNYGWTVEMQLKAAKQKLNCVEVPVSYRRRIGKSKISGTVKGTLLAGYKIILTIFKYL